MAFTFFGEDINLNKNDLLLFKPHPITTAARTTLGSSLGLAQKGIFVTDVDENIHYWWDGIQWLPIGVDIKAKVSANDTTSGYLNGKLVSGTGISLVENNNGSNETLSIINTAPDRIVSLTAGTGISILGAYPNFTIHNLITQYTDEMAQDAVGNILLDSSSIDFTYNDAANTISASVIGYHPTNWNTAYDKYPTALSVTGTDTKTIHLTLNDSSVLTASFADLQGSGSGSIDDTNFAEDNLTSTGNRLHDFSNFSMAFKNARNFTIDNLADTQYSFLNKASTSIGIGSTNTTNSKTANVSAGVSSGTYSAILSAGIGSSVNKIDVKDSGIDINLLSTSNLLKITNLPTGNNVDDVLLITSGNIVKRIARSFFNETDPIANAKTIFLNEGPGITITGATGQTLGSNPSWTISCDITQYTDELAQDAIFPNIDVHNGITGTYDDAGNTFDVVLGGTLDQDTYIDGNTKLFEIYNTSGLTSSTFDVSLGTLYHYTENTFNAYHFTELKANSKNPSSEVSMRAFYTDTIDTVDSDAIVSVNADTAVGTVTIFSSHGEVYISNLIDRSIYGIDPTDQLIITDSANKIWRADKFEFLRELRNNEVRFKVGAIGSPVDNGETTFIAIDCDGNDLINKKVILTIERQEQYPGDDYTYNPATGEITLTYAAVTGQRFVIRWWESQGWTECASDTFGEDIILIDDTDQLLVNGSDEFQI